MSVYFIKAGAYFKIGASDDPERRCTRLNQGGTRYTFPADVSWDRDQRYLYKVVPGWKSEEHSIRQALDQFAVGLEWFLDEPELRAYIDALPEDRKPTYPQPVVERPGGWCEAEYRAVQHGRAVRETARFYARAAS